MAKRKLEEEEPIGPGTQGLSDSAPTAQPSKLSAPRLSIQLTPDEEGIDLARMQPGNRDKLARVLKAGDTMKQLGLVVEPPRDAAATNQLDTMLAGRAVELVGLLAVLGAKRAGYADKHAALMAFGPRESEMLTPSVVAVLGKYNLLGGKYAEELALAAGLGAILADKYTTMKKAADIDANPRLPLEG